VTQATTPTRSPFFDHFTFTFTFTFT